MHVHVPLWCVLLTLLFLYLSLGYSSLSKRVRVVAGVVTHDVITLTKEPEFLEYHSEAQMKVVFDAVHKKCPGITRLYR